MQCLIFKMSMVLSSGPLFSSHQIYSQAVKFLKCFITHFRFLWGSHTIAYYPVLTNCEHIALKNCRGWCLRPPHTSRHWFWLQSQVLLLEHLQCSVLLPHTLLRSHPHKHSQSDQPRSTCLLQMVCSVLYQSFEEPEVSWKSIPVLENLQTELETMLFFSR